MSAPEFKLPWWAALPLAAAAGLGLSLAFPGFEVWIAAPIAVMAWCVAMLGRGFWSGTLISLVASLGFWLHLISWITLYLGQLPWFGLAGIMAAYMALAGGLIALVLRWVPRLWPGALGRYLLVPTLIASIWVGRETLAASWPYGGFSWGRIAMSQTNSPFIGWYSWVGASGVSWLVVAVAVLLLQLARYRPGPRLQPLLAAGTAVAALLLVPVWPSTSTGSMRVLAVQGGVDASLFSSTSAAEIMQAHINATLPYANERVDAVVWPENAAALDPEQYSSSAAALNTISRLFAAPLVVGTIAERDGEYFNSSLQWQYPEGLVNWYDKAHPVPFAEYMPDRAFWRPFAPDLIDLISRDYTAGTRPNVFDLNGTKTGVAICFDIAYDDLLQQMMAGGAQVIFAQTNNADFGHTNESAQQLAIARMRALETGRSVVNISTVGQSAIITGNGQTISSLPTWTPGAMLEDVPLVSGQTPATWLGSIPTTLATGFGVLGSLLIIALAFGQRRRRS